jgi:predicted MFS family arabinose efflux permease
MALALAAIVIIGFLAAQLQTQASVGLEVGTLLLLITGAATAIGQFYLTHEMRKGKRWALISNTVLLGIILCTEAYGAFQQGDYRVSYSIISIVFFVLFWTKDRAYFK